MNVRFIDAAFRIGAGPHWGRKALEVEVAP
jgi:hypothetical protein